MPRLIPAAVLVMLAVLAAQADTVELKSGERLEGKFREADASSVVIEAAGQPIKLALENVRAIYFGVAGASPIVGPAPWQDALDSVRALRSVTDSTISYREYASRVLDAKVKVDRYLSSSGEGPSDLQRAIRVAMLEFELASYGAQDNVLDRVAMAVPMGRILQDADVAKCPAAKAMIDLNERSPSPKLDKLTALGTTFALRGNATAVWPCAAAEVAEAERRAGGR